MNETEVSLIREYVQIHYLIKEAVVEIEALKTSRISLRNMLIVGTKLLGTRMKNQLSGIQKELRSLGIHVWIEDDGGEIVFVCTAKNGVKERNGIKRRVLREDMETRLDLLMKEIEDSQVDMPYKVDMTGGDRYGSSYSQ